MKTFDERILELIISSAKSQTIVADLDNLFDYLEVRRVFEEKNFRIIKAQNSLDVRVNYELEMRGNNDSIILVAPANYFPLPDIEQRVNFAELRLKDIFPKLSIKAIKHLDYSALKKLFQIKTFENLGDEKTLRLVNENIYSVDLVKNSKSRKEDFENLLNQIEKSSGDLSNQSDWFKLIESMAKAMILSLEVDNAELKKKFKENSQSINKKFQELVETGYKSLISLSATKNPAVVSKVLDHIKFDKSEKKALIVVDGMNYWQWMLIADELKKAEISFSNSATFAFIPSITAWSRQAIFRGNVPDLSKNNSNESKMFQTYWTQNGYQDFQVLYRRLSFSIPHSAIPVPPSTQILGLVTNDLDEMMHGTVMGNLELKERTKLWIKKGGFTEQVKRLKEDGFKIFITADHGSVEAAGVKNLKQIDKIGSLSRSKRHIQFSNQVVLETFVAKNLEINFGVSDLSAYLKNDEAFTVENNLVVTHGGSHFWEIVIPFITI